MTRLSATALLALAGCVAQPVSKPAAPAGAGEQVVTAQTVASNAEAAVKELSEQNAALVKRIAALEMAKK